MFTVPYEVRLNKPQMLDWLEALGYYWEVNSVVAYNKAVNELRCIAVHQLVIRSGC